MVLSVHMLAVLGMGRALFVARDNQFAVGSGIFCDGHFYFARLRRYRFGAEMAASWSTRGGKWSDHTWLDYRAGIPSCTTCLPPGKARLIQNRQVVKCPLL